MNRLDPHIPIRSGQPISVDEVVDLLGMFYDEYSLYWWDNDIEVDPSVMPENY